MSIQHKHETDEIELRQRNEVDAQRKANDAKAATQAMDMKALKGRNQSKMDEMCRVMRQIDVLEAQIEASTARFFVLADKVRDERAAMCSYDDLKLLTEDSLAVQMKHIRAIREAIEESERKAAKVTTEGSLKELLKVFKTLQAERDRTRRR